MSLKKIWRKLLHRRKSRPEEGVDRLPPNALCHADAIVTVNEVTDHHGTGVILRRIFGTSPNVLSIRSTRLYPEHSLGSAHLCLSHEGFSRPQSFARVWHALNGSTVQRVLCVPYHADELLTALALKELFGVPLCTYLMDDNNLYSRKIPDELMAEVLAKSNLRLAISPEMRDAYEKKYHLKFWVLPPVVSEEALDGGASLPDAPKITAGMGVLIGSLWSRRWLQNLRRVLRESGLQIHWYGNARAPWLKTEGEDLRRDGLIDCGFVPETELIQKLKDYAFAIVPSGSLDDSDDRPGIARLSLPTRLPFLLAVAHLPTLVLGNPETAAARFVERFQCGRTVPYDSRQLLQAVADVTRPETQRSLRAQALRHSRLFSAHDLAGWIWHGLEHGEPPDDRFERAFGRRPGEILAYLDPPAPRDLWGDFIPVYHALRRLKAHGFSPDFVLDVGSSSGVWSDVARRVFPSARCLLLDPLHANYVRINDWYFRKNPDFECLAVAVSDRPGEATFSVSPDLYGSSLFSPPDAADPETIKVPVVTLDDVAEEKALRGRGLLKIDVQFAEHLVLNGARHLLAQIDVLIVELSLFRYSSQAMLFSEMCELIRDLGFHYYEDVGGWRSPVDGTTLQKDVVFVKEKWIPYPVAETPRIQPPSLRAEKPAVEISI
jgi:FkbM family methyltransferase